MKDQIWKTFCSVNIGQDNPNIKFPLFDELILITYNMFCQFASKIRVMMTKNRIDSRKKINSMFMGKTYGNFSMDIILEIT